ncbi:hypothetical protein H2204_001310 [Knufia peltigerae]|uniref:N-acetyltransferase domain-containing protein n=1 Tax=Knufia peltigerae TaxID=1002370 RepID=A0AA39D3Y0_9EURO|nr:hypothetical protein H2204_001310 [Knufia peltigerae]
MSGPQASESSSLLKSPSTTNTVGLNPHPSFTLRRARFGDLANAARTTTLAFWDEVLFGRLIHPRRNEHPSDFDKYWYRQFIVDWWDWSHVFLVTTEKVEGQQQEVITGLAHWTRMAPAKKDNRVAGWELAWWDPRRLFKPLFGLVVKALKFVSPNRAAAPEHEDILEQSDGFLDHIWQGHRAESWYLACLAVHPDFQGKGQGRALVAWGLEQARKEGVACSVIAADGKERFYQTCGFNVGPVGRGGEGDGNPLKNVGGGLIFFRDKEGVIVEDREPGVWMEGPGVFDWEDWLKRTTAKKGETAE